MELQLLGGCGTVRDRCKDPETLIPALNAVIEDEIKFFPSKFKNLYRHWMENIKDWCISRQRSWGVPIPLFVHHLSRELHPKSLELLEQIANRVSEIGIDAWYDLNPEEILGEDAQNYEKLTDCLDVWFDSGVSHYAVLMKNPALAWPADLYLEGSDQHRGWFNSSLLTSVAIHDQAPYKTVSTHGYVIDIEGRKMSKSLGNYIGLTDDPQTMFGKIMSIPDECIVEYFKLALFESEEILNQISERLKKENPRDIKLGHLLGTADMIAAVMGDIDSAMPINEKIEHLFRLVAVHRDNAPVV